MSFQDTILSFRRSGFQATIWASAFVLALFFLATDTRAQESPFGDSLASVAPIDFDIGGVVGGYDHDWPVEDSLAVAAAEFNALLGAVYMPYGAWPEFAAGPDTSGWENAVDFAIAHGMRVHGHTLLYPRANTNLGWLNQLPDEALESVLAQFVFEMASVRAGEVDVWQVANEVMADNISEMDVVTGLRSTYREYQVIGPDYVEKALLWARAADPDATLIINDYGIATINEKSDRLLAYMIDMRDRGVPIEGVGFQVHLLDLAFEPDYQGIQDNIARFAAAGFQVYLTELDVAAKQATDPNDFPTTLELERQARIYGEITRIAVEEPGCRGILLWDFIDERNTFLHPLVADIPPLQQGDFTFPSPISALGGVLFPKPAYFALKDALANAPRSYWLRNRWDTNSRHLARSAPSDPAQPPGDKAYFETLDPSSRTWRNLQWQLIPIENPRGQSEQVYHLRSRWEPESGYLTRVVQRVGDVRTPSQEVDLRQLQAGNLSQVWAVRAFADGTVQLINLRGRRTGRLMQPFDASNRPSSSPSFQGLGNEVSENSPGLRWFLVEVPRGYALAE